MDVAARNVDASDIFNPAAQIYTISSFKVVAHD